MRLAATLTPMRHASRRAVALRGTLRDEALLPHDVVIHDLSASGFLAELPPGVDIDPGTRVRVAATPIGVYEAIVERRDRTRFGFSFTRPLGAAALAAAMGAQESSVAAFPAGAPPADGPVAAGVGRPPVSARVSLLLACGLAGGLWALLAAALWWASALL